MFFSPRSLPTCFNLAPAWPRTKALGQASAWEEGPRNTLQGAGGQRSAATHREGRTGTGLGEVGFVPPLSPSSPAHIWREPRRPKALSGVTEVQSQAPQLAVTLQGRPRHRVTLPERRGSSGDAMRGEDRERTDEGPSRDGQRLVPQRTAGSPGPNLLLCQCATLRLCALPCCSTSSLSLLLLISATSSSRSLPAISKAASRPERLSRRTERIP